MKMLHAIQPTTMIGTKLFLTGNLNIKQGAEMWGGLIKFGVVL
jgi:predicted transcriptional regulator